MAHVFEMNGDYDKGLNFLESTVSDWHVCNINSLSVISCALASVSRPLSSE